MRHLVNLVMHSWDKTERSFVLALRSLWLHKLRSMLSVLGIIFGTAAVISLMAFGEGSMQDALEDIARQGATNIIVRSIKPPDDAFSQRRSFVASYGLTEKDYDAFKKIETVVDHVPMRVFPQEVRRLHRMHLSRVVATTEDYPKVNRLEMLIGRFLLDSDDFESQADDVSMRNVCVLGSDIADSLFPFESPLGQTIVLNKQHYIVVGVVAERMPTGGSGGSQAAEEFNSDIYIPFKTCLVRFGSTIYIRTSGSRSGEQVKYHQITLKITDREKEQDDSWMIKVKEAGRAVQDWLIANHYRKDWAVTIPLDRLIEAERARDRYKMLLVLIASISLLVGGIGIMNIMLATVTERTREIGVRRALGAKRRDITMQFIIEAVAQTTIGGLCGLALGLGIVFGVPFIAQHVFGENLPSKLHVPSIFLALGVAVGVGVLFGWYPARRASRLDPIEALRHE